MKTILKFLALCAIAGFVCGVASAQTYESHNPKRDICIASVRIGQQAYVQATSNAQTVHWTHIKQSVEFWGALQNFKTDFDISYRAAIYIAFRVRALGYAEVSEKITRPAAVEFMIQECYR